MEINPDSKTVDGISTLVMFIILNLLYLLCCVPIVTIGAATAALFDVMHRFAEEDRGHLIRGFFGALRREWRQGSAVYAIFGVPVLLLAYSAVFWISFGGFNLILGIVAAIGCVYGLMALVYALVQVALYENTVRQVAKNSLMFPMAHPVTTIGILALLALAPALMLIFKPVIFLYATVAAAFTAYLIVRITGRAFAQH
ncbi:MAG: YesL family protein [Microbacteriaceae bacterium]|nr:YesL family protein [Microbacteriaceae bacterium]MCL2796366.1 YesL family protein [Microbacteriaceae bacterium]